MIRISLLVHQQNMGVLYEAAECSIALGIGTGNPGVFQGYPHPYPRKPVPAFKGTGWGTGFRKTRGYANPHAGILQDQPRYLATAAQMSIDTAMRCCEDKMVLREGTPRCPNDITVEAGGRQWRQMTWPQCCEAPLALLVASQFAGANCRAYRGG